MGREETDYDWEYLSQKLQLATEYSWWKSWSSTPIKINISLTGSTDDNAKETFSYSPNYDREHLINITSEYV